MEQYIQKKKGRKLEFKFEENQLIYSYKSDNTDSTTPIHYKNMDVNNKWFFVEKNDWYRNVGLLWVLLGIAFEIPKFIAGNFELPFWFLLGVLFLIIFHYKKLKFTVIDTGNNRVLILRGKHHDEILNKILDYRKKSLNNEFGAINYDNEMSAEINKFRTLMLEGAIDEVEFKDISEKIENHHKNKPILSNFI